MTFLARLKTRGAIPELRRQGMVKKPKPVKPEEIEQQAGDFLKRVMEDLRSWNALTTVESAYAYFSKRYDPETARYLTLAYTLWGTSHPLKSEPLMVAEEVKTGEGTRRLRR